MFIMSVRVVEYDKVKEVFCLYNKIVCFCYRVIICVSYMISVWRGMGVSVTNVSVVHR